MVDICKERCIQGKLIVILFILVSSFGFSQSSCKDEDCYESPIPSECIEWCTKTIAWRNILLNSDKIELKALLSLENRDIRKIYRYRKGVAANPDVFVPEYDQFGKTIMISVENMDSELVAFFSLPENSLDRENRFKELKKMPIELP